MRTDRAGTRTSRSDSGFTLIELIIVIAIIGIIATMAVAQMRTAPQRAREAVLKEDLFAIRDVIDQYFADKGKYPESLDSLIEDGYLRKLPVDPITGSDESWQTVQAEATVLVHGSALAEPIKRLSAITKLTSTLTSSASCFVDSWGNVFPCTIYDRKVGSLRDVDYDLGRIWRAPETVGLQQEIWDYHCPQCWTPCEAYQSILGNVLRPARAS